MVANKFPNDGEKQKKAEALFKTLNEANSNNDLKKVSQILSNLENGIFDFQQEGDSSSMKREVLEARLSYLKQKLEILRDELIGLRRDKTYRQVIDIHDFEVYYQREDERLNAEFDEFKK